MTATLLQDQSREIACTRVYKAPKELLMRMWSNPEHISNWWGPRGFTTTTHAMDFKTGGIWRFTMHGPDGMDYPNTIRYTLISPDCIAYEHSANNGMDFTVRVDFYDVSDGAEMSFRMTFPTAEMRRLINEQSGADEGLRSTVERLGEYAAGQDPKSLELVVVRQLNAPQDRVWKALTEPAQLSQWFSPIGWPVEVTADALRVGVHQTTVMTDPSGERAENDSEYLEIEPIHHLKMTQRWKKGDGTYTPATTITYTLNAYEGKTTMTVVQSGLRSEESRAAHLCGWDSSLQTLAVLVGATKADRVLELVREFDAPMDLVWKCWTTPDRLASWFAPRPYTCPKCEIDLQLGGSLILVMRGPEGDEHVMSSTIVEYEPQSAFGWINSVMDGNGDIAIAGGAMVGFEDLGARTRVTVHAYAAAYSDVGIGMVGGMEQGWNMTLDQMVEAALAQTKPARVA